MQDSIEVMTYHPCFSGSAHFKYGRIHLPVAPRCNIQCAYCDRRFDCPNESRPGVTSKIVQPAEAVELVKKAIDKDGRIKVAGIAGPGEPLANPETIETFRMLKDTLPNVMLCLSTNGLMLPDMLEELSDCGVKTITVTINAASTEAASKIYQYISYKKEKVPISEGLAFLLQQQQKGIERASRKGILVKVNTVLIPDVNEREVPRIAEMASKAGVKIMNITPLIPAGQLNQLLPPSKESLISARKSAERFLPQFTHCRQCRADACGVPGEYKNERGLLNEKQ